MPIIKMGNDLAGVMRSNLRDGQCYSLRGNLGYSLRVNLGDNLLWENLWENLRNNLGENLRISLRNMVLKLGKISNWV